MNRNRSLLIVPLIFLVGLLSAQNTVKYGNEYLAIGVGARAHGMGKSVVASVQGSDAGYWNPAGLVIIPTNFQVNFMHAEWFGGVAKFDYLSFANSLGKEKKAALGISVIRLGIDDIPYTFNLVGADGSVNPDLVTGFSYADYAGIVTYSRKLKPNGLRFGGNAKVIYRSAGRFGEAWGFGVDLGLQYDVNRWRLGLMARDVTSTFTAWSYSYTQEELAILQSTGNEISDNTLEIVTPTIILGTGFNSRKRGNEKIGFAAELNLNFTTDGQRNVLVSSKSVNIDPSLGLEFDYKKLVFLRAGANNVQEIRDDEGNTSLSVQPNMGLGLKLGPFNIDYALNNVGSAGNTGNFYSQIISLTINFKQKTRTKEQLDASPDDRKVKKKDRTSNYPDFIEQID